MAKSYDLMVFFQNHPTPKLVSKPTAILIFANNMTWGKKTLYLRIYHKVEVIILEIFLKKKKKLIVAYHHAREKHSK